jgi:PAS domain S-box-containing protein
MKTFAVFMLDPAGNVSGWNAGAEAAMGYAPAAVLGRNFSLFFPSEDRAADKPGRILGRARAEGSCDAEGLCLKADGTALQAEVRVTAQFDGAGGLLGFAALAGDLSGRREREGAELELQSQKLFSDIMMQSMPGILYLYDTQGRFLRWNRTFETSSGFSEQEIARMHPLDFFPEGQRSKVQSRIEEVFATGASSVEADFMSKDGSLVPYSFSGRRVNFQGRDCLVGVGIDIRELVRAQAELVVSESKYRELVENANSIILRWNARGELTFMNEYGQKFFGYGSGEILGRHVVGTIVPWTESGGRDLSALMDEICADPKAFEQNVNENVRRNGERVWIAWTNRIQLDSEGKVAEILSIGSDITDRKRAEEARRETEANYRKLFEYAPEGILIADSQSRYLDANPAICRMLGYAREELITMGAQDIIQPEEERQIETALIAIHGSSGYNREWRFRRKDGTLFEAEVTATLMPDGKLMGLVRDISERKRAETEREMRERAEAADHIKSAFLATMSHELRTPLNSIVGFTGILLQGMAGPLNPEQNKQLEMVRSSARHLLALVNDVLDISKIEAGQLEVERAPFDVRDAIDKAASLVGPQVAAKGLALRLELAPDLGLVTGDARRFGQILLNLLSNGVKFTDRGGITLAAEAGAAIRVRVCDTGIGIRPGDIPLLFQPFRQIESGLARMHEGTGLGLAICGRLAALMGGGITVESEWGKGTTFTLTLPLYPGGKPET